MFPTSRPKGYSGDEKTTNQETKVAFVGTEHTPYLRKALDFHPNKWSLHMHMVQDVAVHPSHARHGWFRGNTSTMPLHCAVGRHVLQEL